MANKILSIIVPSYNHARFLDQRISSITGQTWSNYELIIIDDASQDGSAAKIKDLLRGHNYQLIVYDKNSGSPHGRWADAIAVASGRYIWIAESDDSCDDRFVEILISHLESTQSTIAFSRTITIDEKGRPLDRGYWPEGYDHSFFSRSQTVCSKIFLKEFMSARNCIPNVSSAIFRIEGREDQVLAAAKEASKYRFVGDWIFWINLLSACNGARIYYERRSLTHHRTHANTTRSILPREGESKRMSEYSNAINKVNHSLSESMAKGWRGHWDWSFREYLFQYKPSLIERLTGQPFHGFHRIGYFSYKIKLLFTMLKRIKGKITQKA